MARNTAYPVFDDYCVYVIQEVETEFLKIGVARNPVYRLSALQGGNPRKLQIAFTLLVKGRERAHVIEFNAHRILAQRKISGEWFKTSVAHATAVINTAAQKGVPRK